MFAGECGLINSALIFNITEFCYIYIFFYKVKEEVYHGIIKRKKV